MGAKQYLLLYVLVAALTLTAPATAALLEGNVIQSIYFRGTAPDTTLDIGPVSSLVGAGVELTNFADFLNIDFSDTAILITATRDAEIPNFFELIRFTDVNSTIPNFMNVTVGEATNFAGFDASRITFAADLIDVNMTSLPALQGQVIALNVAGAGGGPGPGPDPGPVIPEPTTMALLGLGVGFLSLCRAKVGCRLVKGANGSA